MVLVWGSDSLAAVLAAMHSLIVQLKIHTSADAHVSLN